MLSVSSVTRRYKDFTAVKTISFEVTRCQVIGLLGHNGAGKSTLMRMLAGILQPSSGEIHHARGNNAQDLQRSIGYLPENCPLRDEMRVGEYLFWRASLYGLRGTDAAAAVTAAMQKTGITQRMDQRIATLSRGYRQRVGVAQAILHEPDLIILDEPTNGLDPQQILMMRDLLKRLAETAIVIVSTHILQEVQATCERVLVMRRGELVNDILLNEGNETCVAVRFEADVERCRLLLDKLTDVSRYECLSSDEETSLFHLRSNHHAADRLAAQIASRAVEEGLHLIGLDTHCDGMEQMMIDLDESRFAEAAGNASD